MKITQLDAFELEQICKISIGETGFLSEDANKGSLGGIITADIFRENPLWVVPIVFTAKRKSFKEHELNDYYNKITVEYNSGNFEKFKHILQEISIKKHNLKE